MTRRKGFHGILDLGGVPCADFRCVHHRPEAGADSGEIGFTDGEEVWSKPTNGFFQADLEERAGDERICQAEYSRRGISEAPDAGVDLTEEDCENGDEGAHDTGGH